MSKKRKNKKKKKSVKKVIPFIEASEEERNEVLAKLDNDRTEHENREETLRKMKSFETGNYFNLDTGATIAALSTMLRKTESRKNRKDNSVDMILEEENEEEAIEDGE